MAFGASFARAAQDDQTANALAQQALEEQAEHQAPGQRPAAPTAATPAPTATAAAVSRPRPTFNVGQRPSAPAVNAPVAPASPAPTPVSAVPAAPVPVAAPAPASTPPAGPRRFVRPSLMGSGTAPTPTAPVNPAPAPAAQRPAPVAAAAPAAPRAPTPPATPVQASLDLDDVFTPARPAAVTAPVSAPQPAPQPAPSTSAAQPPAATPTPAIVRPRPAFGRPSAAAATGAAPRAGGFRPGGFQASGMGEAPPQPTGEDDDQPTGSAPRETASVPTPAPVAARPRPAVPAPAAASASTPRAGGFRGNGAGASPARPTGEENDAGYRGRAPRSEGPNLGPSGLPIRLDRLIDVVCEYNGLSGEEIEKAKRRALADPDAVSQEFDEIFRNEVEPYRKQNAQRFETLKQAMDAHPEKIVFMHVKDGKQGLVGIDRAQAGAKAMYEGQLVETVDASRTMFKAPSVLFAAPVETVVDEAAFDEPSESTDAPAPASRGMRP